QLRELLLTKEKDRLSRIEQLRANNAPAGLKQAAGNSAALRVHSSLHGPSRTASAVEQTCTP
ncbi:unnamed protein product, partial [Pylaiella littoralis]